MITPAFDTSRRIVEWLPDMEKPAYAVMVQLCKEGEAVRPNAWSLYRSHPTPERAEQSAKDLQRVIGGNPPHYLLGGVPVYQSWYFAPVHFVEPKL